MSLPTCNVLCKLYDSTGAPVEGAKFTFTLNRYEVYQGYVVPVETEVTTNALGQATAALWPNELGSAQSSYRVLIQPPEGKTLRLSCSVPSAASADLEDIAEIPPWDGKQDFATVYASLQGFSLTATSAATAAGNSATAAQASATASAASATAAASSSSSAQGHATAAANSAAAAQASATGASNSAASAIAIATDATKLATTNIAEAVRALFTGAVGGLSMRIFRRNVGNTGEDEVVSMPNVKAGSASTADEAAAAKAGSALATALTGKANVSGQEFTGAVRARQFLQSKAFGGGGSDIAFMRSDDTYAFASVFSPGADGINASSSGRGHVTENIYNPDGSYWDWDHHKNGDGVHFFNKGQPRFGASNSWTNTIDIPSGNIADVPLVTGVYRLLRGAGVIGAPGSMIAAGFADVITLYRQMFDGHRYIDTVRRASVTSHAGPVQSGGVWDRVREFNPGNNTWSETSWRQIDGPAVIGAAAAQIGIDAVGIPVLMSYQGASTVNPGDVVSGSDLRYANASGAFASSPVPTGSWKCIGMATTANALTKTTNFLKVS